MNALALLPFVLLQLVPSHAPSQPAAESASGAGGLSWSVPKGWMTVPSASQMRKVTYKIPAAAGDAEPGEMAVFFFGQGQGGSVESNVERWMGQFESDKGAPPAARPKVLKIGTIAVTLVSASGTYASGMPGTGQTVDKRGWALYGAIAQGPQGPVFFKLVGPKKTIERSSGELDALVKSLKPSQRA
ncbi:MAG: hypothetical protein ABIT01_10185 [Thermoanaerobaculia bacterium]